MTYLSHTSVAADVPDDLPSQEFLLLAKLAAEVLTHGISGVELTETG
jgi:hypothetical protein